MSPFQTRIMKLLAMRRLSYLLDSCSTRWCSAQELEAALGVRTASIHASISGLRGKLQYVRTHGNGPRRYYQITDNGLFHLLGLDA